MSYLQVNITLPSETYHGLGDGGKPEWPPSPMRLFQAIVAVAARREEGFTDVVTQSLNWFASLPAPVIFAPHATTGVPFTTSVPNNSMDVAAQAWSRGNETAKDAQPSTHRAMKPIRTTHFEESAPVVYLWKLADQLSRENQTQIQVITQLVKGVYALGWGVDLVAGFATLVDSDQIPKLNGERWLPLRPERGGLRVPNKATLKNLQRRHQGFMKRISGSRLNSLPHLSPVAYDQIRYQRESQRSQPHVAAFQFLQIFKDGFRPFSPLRAGVVAAMLRHATAKAAEFSGWTQDRINAFVLGHGENRNQKHIPVGPDRLAYLPLPSLERRREKSRVVGAIRRAIFHVPSGNCTDFIAWANRSLDGFELIAEGANDPQAIVSSISSKDRNVRPYLQGANVWESVTPIVLPGRDDHKQKKTERLIRKAMSQAGFSETLAAHAEIDWRSACFWPGGETASRYFRPRHLRNFPCCHCRIRWKDAHGTDLKIPGPIAIGGGRYAGMGLFASPGN